MEHPIRESAPADKGDEPQSKMRKQQSVSGENDYDSDKEWALSKIVKSVSYEEHHEHKECVKKLEFDQQHQAESKEMKQSSCRLAELMSTDQLCQPLVFSNAISNWPAADWTPSSLVDLLHEKELKFRVGNMSGTGIQWESNCQHISAKVTDFLTWLSQSRDHHVTPLTTFSNHWLYSDYTHMKELFDESILKNAMNWSNFGLSKTGTDSTFWLGSEGAYTPCHYDTYGYNLVAQIYGRKRWRLFPPEDSRCLYPTRIPYEESSVYSQVNIQRPDHVTHPLFKAARCYDVTLCPGQVLYVPRHWWHFVESLDTTISINCWVDTPLDDDSRLHESITRLLMCGVMTSLDDDNVDTAKWLNPTEESTSTAVNLAYLSATLGQLSTVKGPENAEKKSRRSCHDNSTSVVDRKTNSNVAMDTTDSCRCQACDVCRQLRELNPNGVMTVQHVLATAPSNQRGAEQGVAMETASLSLSDVMSCVTKPDVIELIGEHLKELVRNNKSTRSKEENISISPDTTR